MASNATTRIAIWCFLTSVLKIACMLTPTTALSTVKSGENFSSDETLHCSERFNLNAFKLATLHLAPSVALRVGFLFSHEKNSYRHRRSGQLCQFARPGYQFLPRLLRQWHRCWADAQANRLVSAGGHRGRGRLRHRPSQSRARC